MLNSLSILMPDAVAPSLRSGCDKPSVSGFNVMKDYTFKHITVSVSENGTVIRNGLTLNHHDNGSGYKSVSFGSKLHYVHRLVCLLYNGESPDNKPYVNHKDGDRSNNHFSNLEWVSASENIKHSYDVLLREHPKNQKGKSGFNHHYSKPVDQICINTGLVLFTFGSKEEAAKAVGVDPSAIYNAIVGRGRVKSIKGFRWAYNPEGNTYVPKFIYYYEDGKRKRKLNVI